MNWMKGHVGAFAHFLPEATDFTRPDEFDVDALVSRLVAMRADWFVFTLGQNTGYYNAPNAAYERIAGYAPGTRCSSRDIPGEIAAALRGTGIRFGLYLPAQAANRDVAAGDRFGLGAPGDGAAPGSDGHDRRFTPEAVAKWSEVIAEWSARYGSDVSLWWFDGCYPHIGFHNDIAIAYKDAVRRGNPTAGVAFNGGVEVDGLENQADFWAGEVNDPLGVLPPENAADSGRTWHVLTFLGRTWGDGSIRLPDDAWRDWLAEVVRRGGAVTLDMAIARPSGQLNPEQSAQFARIRP